MVRTQPARASKAPSSQEQAATATAAERTRTKSIHPVKPATTRSSQQSTQLVVQKAINNENTSSLNTQTVSVSQSLEVVQTLLHSCLSSLAFTRGLFMENVYQKRFYHASDNHWSYEDFASGKHTYDPKVTDWKAQGLAMWAFNRGVCKRVDQFLQLMENGVFDALRRGYLESLLVIIREHSESPENMLERYTFTFETTQTLDGSQVISGIVMSDRTGPQIKMRDARRSLSDFVRKLINLCYNMPALPDRAKLSLEITYTEDCPNDYYAPHFSQSGSAIARFPDDERCEKQTVGVGKLNAGFHSVALKVSHMEISSGDLDNVSPHANPEVHSNGVHIPSGLQYGSATDKFDDIDGDFAAHKETALSCSPQRSATSFSIRSAGTMPKSSVLGHPISQLAYSTPQQHQASPPQDEDAMDLDRSTTPPQTLPQSSMQEPEPAELSPQNRTIGSVVESKHASTRAVHEREQLRNMLQPIPRHSDAQETQIAVADTQMSEQRIQETARKVVFSADTIERLDLDRSCTLPQRKATRLYYTPEQIPEVDRAYAVSCECGFSVQEPEMLHCGFCDQLQHVACYGYDKGADDEQIPETQVCYSCLLKKDNERLNKLKGHAFYRRAIHPLLSDSFDSNKRYAQAISYNPQDVSRILKKLNNDRLLTSSSGSKKSKCPVALASDMYGATVKAYFDPTFLITDHIEAPASAQSGHHGPAPEVPRITEAGSRSVRKRGLDLDETAHTVSTPKRLRRSGRPAFDLDTANYPSPQAGL